MAEEAGIPGHAAKTGWAKRLQGFLRDRGISFEAEGEATRIHLGDIVVEVAEAGGGRGYAVVITVPLPGSSREADEAAGRALADAIRLAGLLGAEGLGYELDTSLPGYPSLRIIVEYMDPRELADTLIAALEKYLAA